MERLDGFTADGFGNVIAGQIQSGDVVRVGSAEFRWYPPEDAPVINTAAAQFEFRAAIQRKAATLAKRGDFNEAAYLLRKHGL